MPPSHQQIPQHEIMFLLHQGAQYCQKCHPAAVPFAAHYVSGVLPPSQSEGVVLQGLPHPPRPLAMRQQHALGLFYNEIPVFMEEERKDSGRIYFADFACVEKSLQVWFDRLTQPCISPGLRMGLGRRDRASRCPVCPCGEQTPRARCPASALPRGPPGAELWLVAARTSPLRVSLERLDGLRVC